MEPSKKATSFTLIVMALLFVSAPLALHAQFGPFADPSRAPQARSQEELDAYLELRSTTEAQKIVQLVDGFATRFPISAFLDGAYQDQALAYQRLGNFSASVAAGEKSLQANPDNIKTLLAMATIIANGPAQMPNRAKLLTEAEDYAHRALEHIDTSRPPKQIPMEQWLGEKREMQCQAHEALGVLSLARGQIEAAVNEFEAGVALAANPDGTQFFRLGLALALAGKVTDAEKNLQRAKDLGPDTVAKLASEQMEKLHRDAR
jgi:tetratricopeptide (TPR) repeat protein